MLPLYLIVLVIGLGLIFLGFILIILDFFHYSISRGEEYEKYYEEYARRELETTSEEEKKRKRKDRTEGLVLIGPFPIVIKSERASRIFEILIVLTLVFFFVIFIIVLLWSFSIPLVPIHVMVH